MCTEEQRTSKTVELQNKTAETPRGRMEYLNQKLWPLMIIAVMFLRLNWLRTFFHSLAPSLVPLFNLRTRRPPTTIAQWE